MRKDILIVLTFILAAVAMIACSTSSEKNETNTGGNPNPSTTGAEVSFAAPDLDGKVHTYDEFAGQPLIINFWGTWCGPCRREMPDMKRIYDEYKDRGLEIIGIAVERNPAMAARSVQAFVEQFGYDWVMLLANQETAKSLKLGSGVPYTIFVDREGKIVGKNTGIYNYQQFKAIVEQII